MKTSFKSLFNNYLENEGLKETIPSKKTEKIRASLSFEKPTN